MWHGQEGLKQEKEMRKKETGATAASPSVLGKAYLEPLHVLERKHSRGGWEG